MKRRNDLFPALISTLLCLLPMLLAAVLYDRLPEQMAVHWNMAGEPDGFAHKAFASFGLPGFLAGMNLLVHFGINADPKRARVAGAMRTLALWMIPVMSLVLTPITLFIALGIDIPISMVVPALVGVLFVLIGNYMPKNKQNYTVGIRLPWTLHDPDNWNKTHRLAGPLWIVGGLVMIVQSFLTLGGIAWGGVTLAIIASLAGIPIVYSYLLYRKSARVDKE